MNKIKTFSLATAAALAGATELLVIRRLHSLHTPTPADSCR